MEIVDFFAKFLVKILSCLETEEAVYSSDFDNCAASLLIMEQLIIEANEEQTEEIKRNLVQMPQLAKSASLLLTHMHDEGTYICVYFIIKCKCDNLTLGTSATFQSSVLPTVVNLMVGLTDYSLEFCSDLALTGFIAFLLIFLDKLDKYTIFQVIIDI